MSSHSDATTVVRLYASLNRMLPTCALIKRHILQITRYSKLMHSVLSDVHLMNTSTGSNTLSQEIFCNLNSRYSNQFKGAILRFAHLEKLSLHFSSSSFVIRVNLFHHLPSLFLYSSLSFLWCFSILVSYYFQVPSILR